MKRRKRTLIISIVSVIIISNLPPISYLFQEKYHYQNKDRSFEFTEMGGPTQNFESALARFESYKRKNPENPNRTLYRTFTLKPWKFWEWWEMIAHSKRFRLPFHPSP
ncbi:hypothetical protein [Pedobacter psychrodurus]|uniref:hypothetical protein n=1 Tax=Pedobacter psychrodurus TaxID=2530456 RepID=UPI00292EB177|nr:hypothetical protein [Pedobacter psychrodurus]